MMERKLYIVDNTGKLRYWVCRESLEGLEIEHGVVGGTPQFQYESVEYGKAGRTQDEQIESRINSRTNKQIDKGYTESMEEALTRKAVNALGLVKPMLAKKSEDVDMALMMSKPFYIQNKLDGNRCLIHFDGESFTAYTRNGKPINTISHIIDELSKYDIPAGITFDGELYMHGTPLQTIVSYIKRKQVATKSVQYHIYDIVSSEKFSTRLKRLRAILSDLNLSPSYPIKLVETLEYGENNPIDLGEKLEKARALLYEGLMFRSDYSLNRGVFSTVGYEDGKRSGSLIKLKDWESEEFEIVDITPSEDQWAVLHCITAKLKQFKVSCPGDVGFKRMVLVNKNLYIGKKVSVDFAYWTKDDIPFQPTATAIRDYE